MEKGQDRKRDERGGKESHEQDNVRSTNRVTYNLPERGGDNAEVTGV